MNTSERSTIGVTAELQYALDAVQAGASFLGMQKMLTFPTSNPTARAIFKPLFSDPLTRSTFTLRGFETIAEALARHRSEWTHQGGQLMKGEAHAD